MPERTDSAMWAWLTAFFALGTVFFYEATFGASWGMCSVVSTIPTFLALTEIYDKRRPLMVGLWATLAAFARYDLVLTIPVYLLLWRCVSCPWRPSTPHPPREKAAFFLFPALGLLTYFALNLVRFHTFIDPTLGIWFAQDAAGGKIYPWGAFSLHYLPLGIFTALFAGPNPSLRFPFLRPTAFGQSLLTTSPALLLALRYRPSPQAWLLLAGCALSMGPALTVWSNGVEQFGARYWIQALPFLLALMVQTPLDRFAKTLILTSILFCMWGTFVVRLYGWAG